MTRDDLETVEENDDSATVLAAMKRREVRRIAVTNKNGKLVGVIAQADVAVADEIPKEEVAEVVKGVRTGTTGTVTWQGPSGSLNGQALQHNLDWVWPYWVERQVRSTEPIIHPARVFRDPHQPYASKLDGARNSRLRAHADRRSPRTCHSVLRWLVDRRLGGDAGRRGGDTRTAINCPVGMAIGAALFSIAPHARTEVRVEIPLEPARHSTARSRGEESASLWSCALNGAATLRIPDQRIAVGDGERRPIRDLP